MMKRVAAAVLCAVLNLLGQSDIAGAVDDSDVADDSGDLIEVSLARSGANDASPIAIASAVSDADIECAWVAERERRAVAAATVGCAAGGHSLITLSAGGGELWHPLLERSLEYCRNGGALKVSIESAGASPLDVQNLGAVRLSVFTPAPRR